MPRNKRKRQEVQAPVSQEEVVKADSPVEESQESKKQKTDGDDEVNLAEGEQEIQNEEQKENFKGAAIEIMGLKVTTYISIGLLTDHGFAALDLSQPTQTALSEAGFEKMTEVQSLTIPYLLAGGDLLAAARTGSGKTLAFLIPAIEMLHRAAFKPRNGTPPKKTRSLLIGTKGRVCL